MKLYKREKYLRKIRSFYDTDDLIKVITGVRRCGKSSLMETIATELRQKGVSDERIIYLDLDKRGYRSIKKADQLDELIESCCQSPELKYLFIDEIQNVEGFEEVINGFRTEGGWSIFITGSNSYLLSGELVTKLTGRYIEFEMYTLTFDEYERMKEFYHIDIDPNPMEELNQFILEGGFPRTVRLDSTEARKIYVKEVVREIFEKDIRRRVKIRNTETFESMRRFLINNFGAPMSIKSLHDALNKSGLVITRATVTRYVNVLCDAKILYECPRFDLKSKKSLSGEKKYYLSDLGFYFSENTNNQINYGPVLENIVYLYARSEGYSVSVGRIGKLECDFILRSPESDYSYVQVSYTILSSRETEDREYRALEAINDNYDKYVVTTDYLLQKRNGIKHVNLIDHLKNEELFGTSYL
ncbi:MAG: ATP-binding protein [Eubacterium sp.]|nr:ATP-binding protein [Eubacterium sp.]